MSKTARKIFAAILLVLLIGLPFINWKLGAVLWICAWLVFIFQNLLGHHWKTEKTAEEDDEPENTINEKNHAQD
jgi:ABC-type transport system involved in cytochrome bd biosynthesis fused ATPase/permease subunit